MIPKIIHYCWFGGNPLPPLALECIASWKKFLPDYEIWEWVEKGERVEIALNKVADRVMEFEVNTIPYTAEAYKHKKYAYVSDYARFWIMYNYGGIYFDTDVEVIKPIDDIVEGERLESLNIDHYGFMGFEQDPDSKNTPGKFAPRYCFAVNPGLGFGMTKGHTFMKRMMEHYQTLKFELPPADISWYKTIVAYTTEELCKCGLENKKGVQCLTSITIYPSEYFAPINAISRRLHITKNTRTIHRYMASWDRPSKSKGLGGLASIKNVKEIIRYYLPEWIFFAWNRWKRRSYRIK